MLDFGESNCVKPGSVCAYVLIRHGLNEKLCKYSTAELKEAGISEEQSSSAFYTPMQLNVDADVFVRALMCSAVTRLLKVSEV